MQTFRVAAGINVYNDCASLQRTLDSLTDFDKVYIIDGKYPDYPSLGSDNLSIDGTRELVSQYDNCVYIPMVASQIEKRTRYLKECDCDFLIVIDADEYLSECNWSVFMYWIQHRVLAANEQSRCMQYQVKYESEPGTFMHLARLIYDPNRLYYFNHWTLMPTDIQTYPHQPYPTSEVVNGITMTTDDLLRPMSRLKHDIDYQWDLFCKEGVITPEEHKDVERKKKFAEHIVHEVEVWKYKYKKTS